MGLVAGVASGAGGGGGAVGRVGGGSQRRSLILFFFNAPAPTEIYTLSLHDALPIFAGPDGYDPRQYAPRVQSYTDGLYPRGDRKSTRLNSSHRCISYAVFCLKK